jgi:hypothetical protein
MTAIANVVCDHCGGEVRYEASTGEGSGDSTDWYVGIHGNDSLPSAFGGIWRDYDPEGELFDNDEPLRAEFEAVADLAYEAFEFGHGVTVTDHSGWEYVSPGAERTRKVYVETTPEDDGPAPRATLNFTVKIDPATGELLEAAALDEHGNAWGSHPKFNPNPSIKALFAPMKLGSANLHGFDPRIGVVINDHEIVNPDKSECGRNPVDPATYYGLKNTQAECLKGLNGLLETVTQDAINLACQRIREALGVPPEADHASAFFTGDNVANLERVFRDYMMMEIDLGHAKANALTRFA